MPTTYVLTDTNSDLTSQGSVHNKKALTAAEGGTSLDITLSGGVNGSATWYTEPSVPNLTSWPAGDYTVSTDIDATGADITYTLSLRRVNSSGTLQQTLGTSGTLSGTGLKSFTQNIASPITTAAGDRLIATLTASRGASHGNQTLTISVNGANDKLIGAWSASTTFFQTLAATAVGVAGLTTLSTFLRTLAASAVGVAVLSTVKIFARTLGAMALGVATLTSASVIGKTLTATAVGVASLATALLTTVTLAATVVGVATIARVTTFARALATTAVGVASLAKKMFVTLGATATAAPSLAKGLFKTLAATATAIPTLGTALLSAVSMAATAVGVATLNAAQLILQAIAATVVGVASLGTQFIAGGGSALKRTYGLLANVGRMMLRR